MLRAQYLKSTVPQTQWFNTNLRLLMDLLSSKDPGVGMIAPNFSLPDHEGRIVSLYDFSQAKGLLVVFLRNCCPYVLFIAKDLAKLSVELPPRGISMIGINSSNPDKYPDESAEKMNLAVTEHGYKFPYLVDSSGEVAKAYGVEQTPDIFLFDQGHKLIYRAQFNTSLAGGGVGLGMEIRNSVDAYLKGNYA